MRRTTIIGWALATTLALGACGDEESGSDYEGYEALDLAVCDPATGTFTADVDNPYFPLPIGMVATLEGNEDGTRIRVRITVLDETEEVAGVTTRIVEEAEWEDGEQVEISRNYYAQAADGTVCYFGEAVDDYEGGEISGHGGAWRAGDGDNLPGIQMPGTPREGIKYQMEVAPGIAEDMSAITSVGVTVSTPQGEHTDALRVFEWNPLEGGGGDVKYFARGVGTIVDADARLTELTLP